VANFRFDIPGLAGGCDLTIYVHTDEAVEGEMDIVLARLRDVLKEKAIGVSDYQVSMNYDESKDFKQILDAKNQPPCITMTFKNGAPQNEEVTAIINELNSETAGDWVLSAGGPSELKLAISLTSIEMTRSNVMEQMRDTLKHRLNELEIPMPAVVITGDPTTSREILIHLPGIKDLDDLKQFINMPAHLGFHLVVYDNSGSPLEAATKEELLARLGGKVPAGTKIVPEKREPETKWYLIHKDAAVDGRYLVDANVSQDQSGQPSIGFKLNAEGGDRLGRVTSNNIGKLMAVVLDEEILMAAMIESEIGTDGVINGRFTREEAERIAMALKSGALPASFHFVEERKLPEQSAW
jgi:protein-export membrane protein SecD